MILIYNYIVLWSQQVPAVAVLATLGTRACAAHPLGSPERRRVPPCRAGGSNQGGLVNVDRATVLTACSRQNSLNEARSSRDESLGRKGEGSGNLTLAHDASTESLYGQPVVERTVRVTRRSWEHLRTLRGAVSSAQFANRRLLLEIWRRRPDLNRGWRFCRQGRDVYLVDSSCCLVGPTPPLSPVFGRYCSHVVPKFGSSQR